MRCPPIVLALLLVGCPQDPAPLGNTAPSAAISSPAPGTTAWAGDDLTVTGGIADAETATAMGFCLFNNIAIGIERALAEPGIERVAVLDFDVHHCNGTIDLYKDRPEVLICSSFQHPFYPYRYFDIVRPNIINTPLKAGTTGVQFRRAVEAGWLPALQAHRPDMLFISAGFDAHRDDPLGQLLLDETDYAWVSSLITDAAAGSANGRIVSTLEGGYNLSALARSVGAYLEVLLGA